MEGKLLEGKNVDTICSFDRNEKPIKYNVIKKDTTIEYFLNEGAYKDFFRTGELYEEGVVENHRKGEKWVTYYKNGQKQWMGTLKNGTGWTIFFYDNGVVSDSTYLISGVGNDGRVKHWYKSGRLKEVADWKKGKQDGWCKSFFENGQIEESSFWMDGKMEGKGERWFDNGQKKVELFYKNGLKEGAYTMWNKNGNVEEEGIFKDDKKNGKMMVYYEGKDTASSIYYYNNGNIKMIEKEYYDTSFSHALYCYDESRYENGQLCNTPLTDNWYKKRQKVIYYHSNGKIRISTTMFCLESIGKYEEWDENGTLVISGEYEDYPDIENELKHSFRTIQKVGNWEYYNEKGKLIKEEIYDKGKIIKTVEK